MRAKTEYVPQCTVCLSALVHAGFGRIYDMAVRIFTREEVMETSQRADRRYRYHSMHKSTKSAAELTKPVSPAIWGGRSGDRLSELREPAPFSGRH